MNNQKERYHSARNVTFLSAIFNIILGVVKIIFGLIGHSYALFADGLHSFSDLLTDAAVLIASRFGSARADKEHPYGHGRIETLVTVLLAEILLITGVWIIYDALRVYHSNAAFVMPSKYVLLIALLSILINEVLFHVTKRVAKKIKSELLLTNAWHHRSDAFSSLVVLIGISGSLMGYHHWDLFAAIIVGLLICLMGWRIGFDGIKELIDTGLSSKQIDEIQAMICQVPGVCSLHQLRTRLMGHHILLDVHVLVAPMISVSEGHYISDQVHNQLMENFESINDIIVHVDPEDDEIVPSSSYLPSRDEIQKVFSDLLSTFSIESDALRIHYLMGNIVIDLLLTEKVDEELMFEKVQKVKDQMSDITNINIYYKTNGD